MKKVNTIPKPDRKSFRFWYSIFDFNLIKYNRVYLKIKNKVDTLK